MDEKRKKENAKITTEWLMKKENTRPQLNGWRKEETLDCDCVDAEREKT